MTRRSIEGPKAFYPTPIVRVEIASVYGPSLAAVPCSKSLARCDTRALHWVILKSSHQPKVNAPSTSC